MGRILHLFISGFLAAWLALPTLVSGAAVKDVLDRPALKIKDPARAVLLDVTRVDGRLVAVGERGVIIYSEDSGDSWRQVDVPVSTTLTAVFFTNPENGWVVGHSGVILHSTDGGKQWSRQMEGVTAARLALEVAQANAERAGTDDEKAQKLLHQAQLLVSDGPDKPFLDMYFRNDQEGYVIGSYGLIFTTRDGGSHWQCIMDRVENPKGLNLYAIGVADDAIYIAGEQGLFLVSTDNGESFRKIEPPYRGTFFDLQVTASGDVVIVGLRGNAFWSADRGASFNQAAVPVEVSFSAAAQLDDGTLVFANQAGMLLESRDNGRSLQLMDTPRGAPISSLVPAGRGSLMTVGYAGAVRVQLPSADSPSEDSKDKRGQQ